MFNASDAAKYPIPKKENKITLAEKADAAVDIRDILTQMNIWAPAGTFYSYKINCPWAAEHPDGGLDKNCRIFGGTNIYCWAMHGYITPTILYSRWKNIPRDKAAEVLLDERGLLKRPWRERWNDMIDKREETQHGKLGYKSDVIAALHTALDGYSEYYDNEFHPLVRSKWQKVLEILDVLWETPNTDLKVLQEFFDRSLTGLVTAARLVDDTPED